MLTLRVELFHTDTVVIITSDVATDCLFLSVLPSLCVQFAIFGSCRGSPKSSQAQRQTDRCAKF